MQNQQTVRKPIKYQFNLSERDEVGGKLAQALSAKRSIEAEFDAVKAEYKSKISTADAAIATLETTRNNGFEMRMMECTVVFFPNEKVKHYFDVNDDKQEKVLLVEPMTSEDFVTELLQAESKFDEKVELELFPVAGEDFGFLTIGKWGKQWYGAVRAKIGRKKLEERLDSDQASFKKRFDCVTKSLKRYNDWLVKELGKETAAGFQDGIHKVLTSQKDK